MTDERQSRGWLRRAESVSAVFLLKVQSRVMDYLQLQKQEGGIYTKNARFHLSLSFCPPPHPTPFSHISYLSCSQYPFLLPENNVFVLLRPCIPPSLSIPPSICLVLSVTSLPCQATRERGREGGTGPAIVPGQTHRISIVFFLSGRAERWPVTFWISLCQAPSFWGPLYDFPHPPGSTLTRS